MKSQVEAVLGDELKLTTGAAYLVPAHWWQQTCLFNFDARNMEDLVFPDLSLRKYVDSFLLDFEDGILDELQHKCNYLKFSRTTFCPQIMRDVEWKVITPSLWRRATKTIKPPFNLLTFYQEDYPKPYQQLPALQIQVIFCAKNKSEAYVGFLPQTCDLVTAIRAIGYQLGFIQMQNSRIIFPDKNPEKLYYFFQLQNKPLASAPDTLVMAFNLQTANQNTQDFSFGKQEAVGDSNEAVAGELEGQEKSWEHLRNDRTMSTGAETPSFIFSEEDNGDFRVRELFREKKPQEIHIMKMQAEKGINGDLIPIPSLAQEELELELEAIALQINQATHIQKKKLHKEKELE